MFLEIYFINCRYSAPEILRGEMIERRDLPMTDIYSLGLIVYEVWSENESFSELNQLQMIEQGDLMCSQLRFSGKLQFICSQLGGAG